MTGFIAEEEAEAGMAGLGMSEADMERGFAQMSKVYDDTGRELYMGQGDRERD